MEDFSIFFDNFEFCLICCRTIYSLWSRVWLGKSVITNRLKCALYKLHVLKLTLYEEIIKVKGFSNVVLFYFVSTFLQIKLWKQNDD